MATQDALRRTAATTNVIVNLRIAGTDLLGRTIAILALEIFLRHRRLARAIPYRSRRTGHTVQSLELIRSSPAIPRARDVRGSETLMIAPRVTVSETGTRGMTGRDGTTLTETPTRHPPTGEAHRRDVEAGVREWKEGIR